MKINQNIRYSEKTYEGATSSRINPEQQLRRSVLSCLLWEDEFYENGESISDRIKEYVNKVPDNVVHSLAIEARNNNLRHVPLLLLSLKPNKEAIYNTIQRADELAELLAIYWKDGKRTIPAQMKKGLAKAFTKFDEYQLAKYNRDNAIKLRDVLFMCHAKPKDENQAQLWKRLVNNELATPDTWEVALSSGADKKQTWERLLRENKLGYLALLRNLRNMNEVNVDSTLIKEAILNTKGYEKILPFRFIAAARNAVNFEAELDTMMLKVINDMPKLIGNTVVLIDVSGSMDYSLSQKSDMRRIDAAAALGSIVKSDTLRVFTFSNNIVEVPARRGMAGVDAIINSQSHGGTELGKALLYINSNINYDRIIVITDEQTSDNIPNPKGKGYMINVASYKNGVGYNQWTHIDGFSENVIKFIIENEK